MSKSQKYFDPETLSRIQPLGLRAKTLIEGLVAGLHRSPLRGQSIEFAQHREYVPGDDLRQVDWKVYARSDRYYLKQYEDETNLVCNIMLDQSESMLYKGRTSSLSKLEYGQLIACSLAYLTISQQDSAGLIRFGQVIEDWIPATSAPSLLDDMIQVLERPAAASKTNLPDVLAEVTSRLTKPSLIILISDLLDDVDRTLKAIKMLRYAGHDFMLMHVLDRDEVDFPFDHVAQFEGLEQLPSLVTDPLMIAGAYRKAAAEFRSRVQVGCQSLNAECYGLATEQSLTSALPEVLARRWARGA